MQKLRYYIKKWHLRQSDLASTPPPPPFNLPSRSFLEDPERGLKSRALREVDTRRKHEVEDELEEVAHHV